MRIPTRTLKSWNAKLDEVCKAHLREREFKNIEFWLAELWPVGDSPSMAWPLRFEARGWLQIAGVTNAIALPVLVDRLPKGELKLSGTCTLKMTQFGVTPPVVEIAASGRIAVDDPVTVNFTWVVEPTAPERPADGSSRVGRPSAGRLGTPVSRVRE